MTKTTNKTAIVVGGGPAGLMAAEMLSKTPGLAVHLFDAMPSVGRKFLLAGRGGLNLTHSESFTDGTSPFAQRYFERANEVSKWLGQFSPDALRQWCLGLGIETFVGTSGRVFPKDLKAAPLLRAWLHRLRAAGVQFHARHRWVGWAANGDWLFASPSGEIVQAADAAVLAMGGASWSRLGSNGAWVTPIGAKGISVNALKPSNCGFEVATPRGTGTGWSEFLGSQFAGLPVKQVVLSCTSSRGERFERLGEFVLTGTGVEGSLIYAASSFLRDSIACTGTATVYLDLLPQHTAAQVMAHVCHPRGSRSMGAHLKSRLNLQGIKAALLHEVLNKQDFQNSALLAQTIKALPLTLTSTRPIDEAISTAGGVRIEETNAQLMLTRLPGVFCAGEMLDWEAPTGGYLLNACMASGHVAGAGAAAWTLRDNEPLGT